MSVPRLKIHETAAAEDLLATYLEVREGGSLALTSDQGSWPLPEGAIEAVMARFGAPLEPGARLVAVASLELAPGRVLRHVRHLARFDVIARDYLVYEAAGEEALCALATTVAGALAHLGRAAARAGSASVPSRR